ncbi:MAG: lysophospholipid acyltransferase family protein [Actinobacteria bacterium]|nr:lysophospholipid acyltransferase family protein [Actinomycetota bacterium]
MFGYIGYKILEFIAIATPYPVTYFIATFSARLWILTGVSVKIIRNNVSKVLNLNINDKKIHRIANRIFINWAKNIVDLLKHPIISKEKLKQRVEIEGLEHLDNALKKGRGAVIITAHLGNFEWGACRIAVEGYKIWVLSLVIKNRLVGKFFESNRLSKGPKTIYINRMLNVFRILKNNEIVAIPSDRDPTGRAARPFKFFGKTAYLPSGALQIALKSGAPLIPSFIWRKDKYNHSQIIETPIDLIREGDKETLIAKNMEKVLKVMEKYIRNNISEWEMFHDIWSEK